MFTKIFAVLSAVALVSAAPCGQAETTSAAPSATSNVAYAAVAPSAEAPSAYYSAAASSASSAAAPATSTRAPAAGDFSGRATYYAVGLGACGWTNTDSEFVVAMNAAQYNLGDCGKKVHVTDPSSGNSATAEIVDLCPGCAHGSLDMSPALWSYLHNGVTDGSFDAGVFTVDWSYE